MPVDPDRSPRRSPAPFAPRELPRFTATTEQSAPGRRIGTFGLAILPLVPFPLPSLTRFSSSVRKPELESRLLYTGHRLASKQVSARLLPELGGNPGFDAVYGVSMRHQRFTCARLSNPYMTESKSRLLTMTFTTAAFDRSSSWLFEASPYRTAPKGPPSSFVQQNAFASS